MGTLVSGYFIILGYFHTFIAFWDSEPRVLWGSLQLRQPEKLATGSPLGQRTLETRPSPSWASGRDLLTFQDKGKSIFLSLWYRQADGPAANKSSESRNWGLPLLGYKPAVSTGEHPFLSHCWASLVAQLVKNPPQNAWDASLIPRLGRSWGDRRGYPLQYFWASLVAQMVKNSPVMLETWVRSLGWEDSLEKGNSLRYSCLENPHGQRSLAGYSP